MSALPDNIVEFKLPKKPRIKEKEPLPDQRKVAVLPIRAVFDKKLTHGGLKALAAICSFANRAGITWVSQTRLAKDLGITQQAVAKQFKQLRELGYLETIKKGFKGEYSSTLRVIFDPTIDMETAIAVTSSIEDTRPPSMRKEQEQEIDNTINHEGLQRIKDMIRGTLKPMNEPPKEYQMPKGDTITVTKMKAEIAAKKAKTKATNHNLQVVEQRPTSHNPEVVQNTEKPKVSNTLSSIYLKEVNLRFTKVLYNQMSEVEIETTLQQLQHRCQAEGVSMPKDESLVEALLVLHADSL